MHRVLARLRLPCFLSLLCLSIPTLTQAEESLTEIEQKFLGDFELVSFVRFPENGEPIDMQYIGRLSYDAFGNMAGLGMPRDLPERDRASAERVTGGFAYWGKVSYDLEKSLVIHHVEGAPMVPEWVGGDNVRHFEFSDGLLKLSVMDDEGRTTATLSWRKLQ